MGALIIVPYIVANILWFILFSPLVHQAFNFWGVMTQAAVVLATVALFAQRSYLKSLFKFELVHVGVGIISAALLYAFFFMGDQASRLILPFAQHDVGRIYLIKGQMPLWAIGMLLFLCIGPAEEIFWRGFVQERLGKAFGRNAGYWMAALMYALVHVYAMNFMLFMAALLCGLFWGFLYRKFGVLWPVIISHAIWDVAIFVVFPMR